MFSAFSKRLYLRIWLAMVVGLVLLAAGSGVAWYLGRDHEHDPDQAIVTQLIDSKTGEPVGIARFRRLSGGQEFAEITLGTDQELLLQVPRRRPGFRGPPPHLDEQRPPQGEPPWPPGKRTLRGPRDDSPPQPFPAWWARPPYGFLWLLGALGIIVSLLTYPIVRKLTQRLESLQGSLRRWGEGDLSVRVPVRGHDEVADLATHFNTAAERIEQLMAAQHQLLAAQKSLLANASHELRSPLARIRMGLELMGQQPNPAARAEIGKNIAELDQLIDEILLASRLDAREADLGTVESIDLVGLSAEESARVDAELDLQADPDALQVPGVAKLLRRLVRNLLENARRYGKPGAQPADEPAITLRLEVQAEPDSAGWAVIRVLDRGPGVPPELRERIFEPFYRLPGASEREGGVGLGLALVKSIAERHGGNVQCEAREGGGACFVVRLPRQTA